MPSLDNSTREMLAKLDLHLVAMEKIHYLSGFVLGLRGEIANLIRSSETMSREEVQQRYSEIREKVLNIREGWARQREKNIQAMKGSGSIGRR